MLDGLLPHAHELPSLELLEEGQLLDVVVGVALNQPLAKGQELDGGIVFVEGQSLAG